MNIVLAIAVFLVIGMVLARVLKRFGSPEVLSYILGGLLISVFLSKLLPKGFITAGDTVGTIALGFIAFEIGDTFRLKNVREVGSKGLILSVVQAVFCYAVVLLGFLATEALHLTHMPDPMPVALFLASTAAATAPAPTFMVVKEYKARGPLTNYLLMAVTFDDAVGIILFDISIVIMRILLRGGTLSVSAMVLAPLREIALSLAIGAVTGLLMTVMARWFRSKSERLLLAIMIVLTTVGVSQTLGVSSLLACMVTGALFTNITPEPSATFENVDAWTVPLLLMFFVFSGADINLALIPKFAVVALFYLAFRGFGKVFGSWAGARMVKAPAAVAKYLGWAMLPQAGVAIGFAVIARSIFPELSYLSTIVLAIVIIFTMIGPVGAKYALFGAREVDPQFLKPAKKATPAS
ncbi:MAG: cation:proton antiporter [Candidatus Cryosericum sp.]